MGTRYLECTADVSASASWSFAGAGAPASFTAAVDLNTSSLPPTSASSDGDSGYALINNTSAVVYPAAKSRLRIQVHAGGLAPPIKTSGHKVCAIYRKAGTGHFRDPGGAAYDWPSFELWNNGARVAGPFVNTEPGTSFVLVSHTLSAAEAAAIDWTQDIDLVASDVWQGTGTCACRMSAFWLEAPEAYSLEASGSSTSAGEVELYAINGSASGSSTSEGQCAGSLATFVGTASGSSQSEGQCAGQLASVTASGSSSSIGQAAGIPTVVGEASGSSTSIGQATPSITYPPRFTRLRALIGGVVAGKGA